MAVHYRGRHFFGVDPCPNQECHSPLLVVEIGFRSQTTCGYHSCTAVPVLLFSYSAKEALEAAA